MMTATTPPISDDATVTPPPTPAPLNVVGILSDRSQVDDALLAAFYAQRNFSLTSTALQRRADRLHMFRDGRAKVLGAEVKRTAKEYDVHQKGEPWTSYQVAADEVRRALDDGLPIPPAALSEALAFAPVSIRLYDGHKAAVKAKKDELDGLSSKISAVESALANLLRRGIGARADKEQPQTTLPGIAEDQPAATPWMDQGARQTVYDTLIKEMRIVEVDIARAANSADRSAQVRAEQDKRQLDELLGSLAATGLLDGLTPDETDESMVLEDEADDTAPEVDFTADADPELEDPTKHPALAGAIEKTAETRAAKKRAKTGTRKKK